MDRGNFKACFDLAHANRCGLDLIEYLEELKDLIAHIHINDNDGTCDLHMPAYILENGIDFPKIINKLHEIQYNDSILIEVNVDRNVFDSLNTFAGAIKRN